MADYTINFGGTEMSLDLEQDGDIGTDKVYKWAVRGATMNFHTFHNLASSGVQEFYAFTMKAPQFFSRLESESSSSHLPLLDKYNGLFLVEKGRNANLLTFRKDIKDWGSDGCGNNLVFNDHYCFCFNENYFIPILMDDFNVIYYVCERRLFDKWRADLGDCSENCHRVSIDKPIIRDTTLGIYMTRAASLAP